MARTNRENTLSNLNEDEADAFFHRGDAGTYDGGPALSLVPVGMADPLEDEDRPLVFSPEQIARRERLKRLVTTVVGTLGAGSVLLFALRITRSESETAGAASLGAVGVQHEAKPSPPPRTPEALQPTQVLPTPVVANLAAIVAPEVAVEPPIAQAPVAAPVAPEAAPRTAPPVETVHHVAPVAVATTRTASSNRLSSERAAPRTSLQVLPSRVIPSQGSSSRGHTPPTATFPD
jgi:hypothetical protein